MIMFYMHKRCVFCCDFAILGLSVVASGMDKAIVLRDMPNGRSVKMAVIDSELSQFFTLRSWNSCSVTGAYFTLSD